VNNFSWRLVDLLSGLLRVDEREAVCGDLAESGVSGGRALLDLLGVVLRRQASLWKHWRPWLALIGIVAPVGLLLVNFPQSLSGSYHLYSWIIQNYRDIDPAMLEDIGLSLRRGIPALACYGFLMLSWSWTGGFALASLSRRAAVCNGVLLCGVWGTLYFGITPEPRISSAIFLLPFFLGMRQGLRSGTLPVKPAILLASVMATATAFVIGTGGWGYKGPGQLRPLWLTLVLSWPVLYLLKKAISRSRISPRVAALLVLMLVAGHHSNAAEVPGVRAELTSEKSRKPAPAFELKDAAGKSVKVSDYRGKVVLLNFWATWCGGCKVEMPWFQQFQTSLGPKRFSVLGVSVDEEGWTKVKPYLEQAGVTYRMTVADKSTPEVYAVTSLPATFLIDHKGRIAATYVGLVDRGGIEGNIKALLKHR